MEERRNEGTKEQILGIKLFTNGVSRERKRKDVRGGLGLSNKKHLADEESV